MTYALSWPLQKALFSALQGDAELAADVLEGDVRREDALLHVGLALLEHGVDVAA